MIKKSSFKPWKQSKAEIEHALDNEVECADNDVYLMNGIQHKKTISHNSCPIFSVAHRRSKKSRIEFFVLNYVAPDTGESYFAQWKYDSQKGACKMTKKVQIRQCLKILVYIPNQHAYIGYCSDMTLRGYNGITFDEKSRLTVHSSVLTMLYIEENDELITAGQGYVFSWNVKIIEYGFLVDPKSPPFLTEVNSSREWVTRLFHDKVFKTVMALTDDIIYVISLVSRQQVKVFYNSHKASLSYCAFYHPLQYFITAARDGSVHIYHTGVQTLTRSFSAHLDGITGVSCLSNHPILLTWSQKSGKMRIWRLDTMEMTNETTLSQTINKLFIPSDDRLFYLGEFEVQIFSIKILYTIFTSLSSPINTMQLKSIRRVKNSESCPQFRSTGIAETSSIKGSLPNFRSNSVELGKPSRGSQRWSDLINKMEVISNPTETYVKSLQDEDLGFDASTCLGERILCILEDFSIIQVSSVTGLILNITYPSLEIDHKFLSADVHKLENYCYVVMENGKLVNFDISCSPGRIASIYESKKNEPKVSCVATSEVYVDEGVHAGLRAQAIFLGMDNGTLSLANNIESIRANKRKSVSYAGVDKKPSIGGARSFTEAQPELIMAPFQAHYGKINTIFAPVDGSLTIDYENIYSANIYNIILTLGSDYKLIVWRANVVAGPNPNKFEVLLNKLQYLKLKVSPTCLAVTSNIILFGFDTGQIEMQAFTWKYYVSSSGAKIKIECNNISLNVFKNIPILKEFYHKKIVTSAHASFILGLFATTSEDALIKIWDIEGVMVRELYLGEVLFSVSFALGRNLLATLKNYIVLIEAVTYLPAEYLQKLLAYAEEHDLSDPEPEAAVNIEEVKDATSLFATKHIEEDKEAESSIIHMKPVTTTHDDMKNINNLLRYLRRRRSFYTQAAEAEPITESKVEIFSGIQLKDFMPIVKIEDSAEDLYSEEELNRMKKYVVSPDGSIPNSFIRLKYKPISSVKLFRKVILSGSLQDDSASLNTAKKTKVRRFAMKEIDYVGSDAAAFELSDRTSSVNRIQIMELSERAKWEIKDEILEKKADEKIGSKSKTKIRRSVLVLQVKAEKSSKHALTSEATEIAPSPSTMRLNRLLSLLQELNKQRWCSHIITQETFETGVAAIAVILQRAGSRISLEICKLIASIIDASQELKKHDGHEELFTLTLQQRFAPRLAELLFSPAISLQHISAYILSKFNDEILLNCLLTSVMPKFLETLLSGKKILQSNQSMIGEATRTIKYFAENVDTERLLNLSRLCRIEECRDELTDEDNEIVNGVAEALNRANVDSIDLHVWANFILPLISKHAVFHEEKTESIDLGQVEEADRHIGTKVVKKHRRRRSVTKPKVVKAPSHHADQEAPKHEFIKKERVKKRKVSFDDGQLSKVAQPHPPVKPHEEAKITTKIPREPSHDMKPIKVEVEIKRVDEKTSARRSRKESVESGDFMEQMESVMKLRESAELCRSKSSEILRRSSCELKQFQDIWVIVDEATSSESAVGELTVEGVPVSPDTTKVGQSLGASLQLVHSTNHRRRSLATAEEIERNRSILILQTKRKLSLNAGPSLYRPRSKTSEYFAGISKAAARSSMKGPEIESKVEAEEKESVLAKWKAREHEDEFESFLPSIVEHNYEFDPESSRKDSTEMQECSNEKSFKSESEKIRKSSSPWSNADKTSRESSFQIIPISDADSKSRHTTSSLPTPDPFLPSSNVSFNDKTSRRSFSNESLKSSTFIGYFGPEIKSSFSDESSSRVRSLKVELPSLSFDSFTDLHSEERSPKTLEKQFRSSPSTIVEASEDGSILRRSPTVISPTQTDELPAYDDICKGSSPLPHITTPVDPALRRKRVSRKSLSKVRFSTDSESDKVEDHIGEKWRDILKMLREIRLRREERRRRREQNRISTRSSPRPLMGEVQEKKESGDFVQNLGKKSEISKQEFDRKVKNLQLLTTQSYRKVDKPVDLFGESVSCRKEDRVRRVLDRIVFAPNKTQSDNMIQFRRKLNSYVNQDLKSTSRSLVENYKMKKNQVVRPKHTSWVRQTNEVYEWEKGLVLSYSQLESLL